ncbi:uncharacterized protein PV07_07653 [Cladophialophora immunda]|uniref:Uncharacterized protein n=1 Tax=Cladophialophora immunda TaxID=569365 RepID=A0A0D2CC79_9EURO|nr:uncharacterized protein PV07_07653 [Cladophialophora immunda]KIW27960.1 hypothetical protein PV07_07653 [Cladophialophora immunda]OQV02479.1 hypothetical protein CLAIMM_07675 [Cladophialophora immunda]
MDLDTAAHPNPVADRHHRKVELQSPNDLTYLQSNLVACARQKLDLHFPPSAAVQDILQPATVIQLGGTQPTTSGTEQGRDTQGQDGDEVEDPLRARVREVVEAFITRTWEGACKNITVNGLDATALPGALRSAGGGDPATAQQQDEPKEEKEGVDFVHEAYDSRLQARVAALYGELETLTTQVSKLRRTAPARGAETLANRLKEEMEADGVEFERRIAMSREADAGGDVLGLKPLRDGWLDDANAMYERGTNELAALAGVNRADGDANHRVYGASLTETLGKIQRARTVAMEFE